MVEKAVTTKDDLLAALTHDNVGAFLRVIRQYESSQDDNAYRMVNGGGYFDAPPWKHPYEGQSAPPGKAAGAPQFIPHTWGGLASKYGFEDFSPANQDLGAVALIAEHGALDDVIAGRLDAAIRKLTKVWVSLDNPKHQQEAPAIFASYGGKEAGSSVPVAPDSPTTQVTPHITEAKPMGALLPLVLQMIPSLISVFGSPNDSEVAKRNQAAGVLVADTLVKATQANNLADAVGKMQSDPGLLQAATDAVHELLPQLMDVGGGVESARKFAADHENSRYGRILEVVTYSALFFLLLANSGAFAFAWKADDFSVMADIKQADIGVALIAFGYWLGTSISSKRKDEMKGAQ